MSSHRFFATTPKGLESLLGAELTALGATELRETRAGVAFVGTLALAYRACLWSRLANRVLLPLDNFAAPSPEALYAGVHAIPWERHFGADHTLAVDFSTLQSQISHSHYGALKAKDAIVDRFRARDGRRPSVERDQPDIRINVYLYRDHATVYLDLSGDSLHRRRYRSQTVAAPLKENVACGALLRAGWPEVARAGGTLVDPLCGGATLLSDGALKAADVAPGLLRDYYGFLSWRGHDAALWSELLAEAHERRDIGLRTLPVMYGYDVERRAVQAATLNVAAAQLERDIVIVQRPLDALGAPAAPNRGLEMSNPPYGARLGDSEPLVPLYAHLGEKMISQFGDWLAGVLSVIATLGKIMGLRARKRDSFFNGALVCKLLCFDGTPAWFVTERPAEDDAAPLSSGAEMLATRLRKNV